MEEREYLTSRIMQLVATLSIEQWKEFVKFLDDLQKQRNENSIK